ncbi:MAG: 16S rRNA (adenine(1518)-N(6)/adenine(1519)-N(6))-dimethyltransferase RsmA [Armatimonadota bacterium]|nr:16S rRNA (adenine(1518)-N(6)/adenine(1519)-N(6))-dimethyltransferase RsmA [Armatimonadota bacterium]MDW8105182.1 16S rRNA (adenine(1518)-N(6)/adenine(1519)-N(6))-dimethyltransferase RsmA [Armatimonadota bacterium]MDW8289804.1 16S rRNA (adenine(1518)-N(6)/adenine(1519)-N(6))-dimethyltransferase RsmA [Armatimonadota bacterium]
MKLTSPSQIRLLLLQYGLLPDKRKGQHFLGDHNILEKILQAADLSPEEGAMEIGSGIGTLTRALAEHARQVLTFEVDAKLIPIIQRNLQGFSNVRLVHGDFLRQNLPELLRDTFGDSPFKVVANIPYGITSPILDKLFGVASGWTRAVLMIQREVAERLIAEPGTPEYSAITVFAQYHSRVEIVQRVSRTVFYPPPEVDSAIVRFTPLPKRLPPEEERRLFRAVRAAFGQRRKTLLNALSGGLGMSREQVEDRLRQVGIDPQRRGETLSLEEFMLLSQSLWGEGSHR